MKSFGAKLKLSAALLALLSGLTVQSTAGASGTGQDIIQRSDKATRSKDEHRVYKMELVDRNGKVEQVRRVEEYFKNNDKEDVTLQKFLSPPIVKGTGFTIVEKGGTSSEITMYSPSTRRLRAISGAEKSNWYMGTEFAFEDFDDYQIPHFAFEDLGKSACLQNKKCFRIEAVPSNPELKKSSGYAKKIYWIEEESLFPVKVEYFAKGSAEPTKVLESSDLKKVGAYYRPQTIVMKNLKNGRSTRLTLESRELDKGLEDYYVSQRFLRKE